MWALRRASNPLKFRGFRASTSRVCSAKTGVVTSSYESTNVTYSFETRYDIHLFDQFGCVRSNLVVGVRGLASQAGARKGGEVEDEMEDGFSELDSVASESSKAVDGTEDELVSDDEEDVEDSSDLLLELSDTEGDSEGKKILRQRVPSELFKAIISSLNLGVDVILDKWVESGKDLSRNEIQLASLNLRKRRMYGRALQLSEWVETKKKLDFTERDYASRLDLIAKMRGLHKAENYIEKVPNSFRGEILFRTLLANCVAANNGKKAEDAFNKMRDMKFPVTPFACNQLLLLYKRQDKKKIADVLLLMEKENVKPTTMTYKLLIDVKGLYKDIAGMEEVVETMKSEGLKPDIYIQSLLFKHYLSNGHKEKAEKILEEMEAGYPVERRHACRVLLPLYAKIGKANEVDRIWKICESNPRLGECIAVIDAFGQLKKIEEAEAVFEMMLKKWKKLNARHYTTLLKVYAQHKMLSRGKDLVKRMADSGCHIDGFMLDVLVKLHVQAGEVEKADSMLLKAAKERRMKPMFNSYVMIMEEYAKTGDIHNAEKIFHRMRQAGYTSRLTQFQLLLDTYIKAKVPAYGIRDRLKADNLFPNKAMAAQLAQVDAFKKNAVSDLLD